MPAARRCDVLRPKPSTAWLMATRTGSAITCRHLSMPLRSELQLDNVALCCARMTWVVERCVMVELLLGSAFRFGWERVNAASGEPF